jgi:SAM-dependent methyltransferase
MPENPVLDQGRAYDWGRTAVDYARYRTDPPPSFFRRLAALGVGLPGQSILDLGTGTGALARQFARQGAQATGTDIAAGQIAAARALATQEGLNVHFDVASAEDSPFALRSFDAVTAMQCWMYFDAARTVEEVRRVLKPDGALVVSNFSWLPRRDGVARASEQLVRKFNPTWSGADWNGHIPPFPDWAKDAFLLTGMFWYDEAIPFTHEGWRGRFRACRGVGASLPPAEVETFDQEHAALLARLAPERFAVLHRLSAHILLPRAAKR